jgi:streptomycin 6-kinase
MSEIPINIPDLMQHRADLLGSTGRVWRSAVMQTLRDIAARWQLQIERQLSGGTEALVFLVSRSGQPAVLKIGLPGSMEREALTLRLAAGQGYADLLEWDAASQAILLEHLGGMLVDSGLSVRDQIGIVCTTLRTAWRHVDDPTGLLTGADKARSQAEFIDQNWQALRPVRSQAIADRALAYARERARAWNSTDSLLLHGDAHGWNTLQVPAEPGCYKFVDPDGLFAEPAADLAIALREWRDELLSGDALAIGMERCSLLADLTGVERDAIWQWGYIEQVACGLLDLRLGDHQAADQHFKIAESWLKG